MRFFSKLVRYRRYFIVKELLALYGVEIPAEVMIGDDFCLVHRGFGTVIHPNCTIGNRVQMYHQVTIGRADGHEPPDRSPMGRVIIGDDVVLFPGSKVLAGPQGIRIGNGTVLGANAVLLTSTGEREIWAGVPARKIGERAPH